MTMVNKINTGSNPINKLYTGSTEVQKAYLGDKLIYGDDGVTPLLKFTAEEANSTIKLYKETNTTNNDFEISTDGVNWRNYNMTSTLYYEEITLSKVGDYIYIRNKSETQKQLSDNLRRYTFMMTGKISASGDIGYLSCKNSVLKPYSYTYKRLFYNCTSLIKAPDIYANEIEQYCCVEMFYGCTNLVQAPKLKPTTLPNYCYYSMFEYCSNLVQIPALPIVNAQTYSCQSMFWGCAKIKLSTTQTSEYTQPYRIPTTGTGTAATSAFDNMFTNTGGTFTGTPTINTTYYLHKDNTIVG